MTDTRPPRPAATEPVAIVGMSTIMPGARELDGYWRTIIEGRDLMTEVPADRWRVADFYDPDPAAEDKTYCKRGAFLPPVEFDPVAFGLRPSVVEATDTAQLLALVATRRLLDDLASARPGSPDRERVSVYLGSVAIQLMGEMSVRIGRPTWHKVLREHGIPEERTQAICDRIASHCVPWQAATFPGLLGSVVAGRVANVFDLHGANFTVDAACATSLASLSVAVDDLTLGRSDLVITGGVDTLNDPMTYIAFSKALALSRTGECRPFAEGADGTLLGEGVALLALRRLADAERDGDRIYAVIRGIGASSDGSGTAIYAPLADGQARAMRRAYAAAGYGPETVDLVEAHGTGTAAGDAAEVAALREVFTGSGRTDRQWCALGSVKSQIGHTTGAAGAAGVIKAALALHHRVLPPTIKADRPDPALDLHSSPFHLSTTARPWMHTADRPRRASVSSFGFGGANFHVTLEEYTGAVDRPAGPRCAARPSELVPLSASSTGALLARCSEVAEAAEKESDALSGVTTLARRTQEEFDAAADCRLAVVAADTAELAALLRRARTQVERQPDAPFRAPGIHYRTGPRACGPVAFVFPGQGTQRPGMGTDLALHFPAAQRVWQRAAMLELGERPLTEVVFPPPTPEEEERRRQRALLTRTEWAQPALAAHGLALLAVLEAVGVRPDCVAGHSFGELTALHTARVWDADTLLRLARRRGELLRDASTAPGAMLAVDAPAERVTALLGEDSADEEVWITADNAPGQVVLSGSGAGTARAAERCAAAGLAVRPLETTTAFHCPLVAPAAEPLERFLEGRTVRAPLLDVYGTADAAPYPLRPDRIREAVARQVASPVRFTDTVRAMYEDGVRTFVEVGPGQVLTGLINEILADAPHHAIACEPAGRNGVTGLHEALARLAVLGVPLRPDGLWEHHAPPHAAAPVRTSGPSMPMTISGGNHGRRYPSDEAPAGTPDGTPGDGQVAATAEAPVMAPDRTPHEAPDRTPHQAPEPAPYDVPAMEAYEAPAPSVSGGFAPAVPLPPAAAGPGTDIVRALLEVQRQTAEAHAAYLRLAEKSVEALTSGSGAPWPEPAGQPPTEPHGAVSDAPGPAIVPLPSPVSAVEENRPGAAGEPVQRPLAAGTADLPAQREVAPSGMTAAEMEALVLSVVSEKTGYPTDMLAPHMELEADLGLDSITRVQILAALRPMFPALAGLDRSVVTQLATMRTVGEMAAELRKLLAQVSAPAAGGAGTGGAEAGELRYTGGRRPERDTVYRQVPVMRETPAPGTPMAGLWDGTVVVTEDGAGVADEVVRLLRERGVAAESRPSVPADAAGVVLLGGLARPDTVGDAVARQAAALRAARAVASGMEERGGLFVTVQDTGGYFGLGASDTCEERRAWLGGLAALARTARVEWPRAAVKAIDCACGSSPAEVAEAVVAELLTGGEALDVGLAADGVRREPAYADAGTTGKVDVSGTAGHAGAPAGRMPELGALPVIVATGGARGITAAALTALGRTLPARFVLLGRSPADGPHIGRVDAVLAALRETGSQARYYQADVRDRDRLRAVLEEVRADWGPVTGLVHGAGVLADRRIREKTTADFDAVFGAKAEGLAALLDATRDDPLRLLCVFSSLAGTFGNAAQSDYAMANETLNHVVAAQRAGRPDAWLRSLVWGPWDGGMVSRELAEDFRMGGVPVLPVEAGARAFAAELATEASGPQVLLAAGPAAEFLRGAWGGAHATAARGTGSAAASS
ncbi:type I polyketide synthase [Streptomyces sclerotialus]|uniref:type I polyketide synthase n=1 Tax=Streptomyces sclerotialus TaxID=1957 RepID=UPI0007C48865